MSIKTDIKETGDSLQEVKDHFLFFIDYLIDEQVALQCLQMDSKIQIRKNQHFNASKITQKAESYSKALSKKTFQKNNTSAFVAQTSQNARMRGNSSSTFKSVSRVKSPNKNASLSMQCNASTVKSALGHLFFAQ